MIYHNETSKNQADARLGQELSTQWTIEAFKRWARWYVQDRVALGCPLTYAEAVGDVQDHLEGAL